MEVSSSGHSAEVKILLHVADETLEVAQLAPSFLILKSPISHPSTSGKISLLVDDCQSDFVVGLPSGLHCERARQPIVGLQILASKDAMLLGS